MSDIAVTIASDTDFTNLIAEVYYKESFVFIVTRSDEVDGFRVVFVKDGTQNHLSKVDMPEEILFEAIAEAKAKLG